MQGNEWVYVAIATLLGAHLLMLLYAYRSQRDAGAPEPTETAPVSAPEDAGLCRCPQCGTENDVAYRFCKQCVAELPTGQFHLEHPSRQQQPY